MSQSDKAKEKKRIQNTIRGALASLKSASVPTRSTAKWQKEQLARKQILGALAKAQGMFSVREVTELERWAGKQNDLTERVSERLGPSLTSLALLPLQLAAKDPILEIKNAADQLLLKAPSLMEVCTQVLNLQTAFANNDWQACRQLLQRIGSNFGRSYFELELLMSVEQAISGVEGMKTLGKKMTAGGAGFHPYLMHMFGVRNEPAQTAVRFKEQTSRRLNEANDIGVGLKAYLGFRLNRVLPMTESGLASVIFAERLGSLIDLLFTVLSIVRHIRSNPTAFSHQLLQVANEVVKRLAKFSNALNLDYSSEGNKDGDVSPNWKSHDAANAFIKNPSNLLSLGHAALTQLWSSESKSLDANGQLEKIIAGAVSSLSTQDSGVAREDLEKLLLNMGSLPILANIGSTSDVPKLVTIYLEQLSNKSTLTSPRTLKEAVSLALSAQLAEAMRPDSKASNGMKTLSRVAEAISVGDKGAALALLNTGEDFTHLEKDTFQVLSAILHQQADRATQSIQATAIAGVRNSQLIPLLPLDEIFRGARWAALIELGPSIELSICLDLYLRSSGDRRATTYKRFSVEELIKTTGCSDLLELMHSMGNAGVKPELLEYFFDKVCDIATLELLPAVGNSRRAQELRVEVLHTLASRYLANGHRYQEEADLITASLSVNDGLEILDASRVYVDEVRILPSVHRELSADFQRYLDLVRTGVGVSDSFAAVLKTLKHPSEKTFQVPANDAEDLFGEMTLRIRERFLFDPASGLDIHVGRRIRHGTVASQIRGPLESRSLIGQRPKLGADYDPPEAVRDLLTSLDPKAKQRLCAAFSRFSESMDGLIVLLRDEYFHVRSSEKPKGMFNVPVNAVFLALARSIAQECPSIEDYSRHCIQMFWMLLSATMSAARPPMENEVRKAIGSAFEKLTQELRAIGINDPILRASLQQALEELRRRVSELGSWMRVPKSSIEGNTYAIHRSVDAAIALVKGQRTGFKPIVAATTPPNLELDYYGFSVVADMLYIAIDNVCAHSGKKIDNKIEIDITFNPQNSLISFQIESELGKGGWSSEKEARLNIIRNAISKKAYADSARKDKNSGLSKLAALVLQSDATSISFEFVGKAKFVIKFDLHYVQSDRINRGSYEELIESFEKTEGAYSEISHAASTIN